MQKHATPHAKILRRHRDPHPRDARVEGAQRETPPAFTTHWAPPKDCSRGASYQYNDPLNLCQFFFWGGKAGRVREGTVLCETAAKSAGKQRLLFTFSKRCFSPKLCHDPLGPPSRGLWRCRGISMCFCDRGSSMLCPAEGFVVKPCKGSSTRSSKRGGTYEEFTRYMGHHGHPKPELLPSSSLARYMGYAYRGQESLSTDFQTPFPQIGKHFCPGRGSSPTQRQAILFEADSRTRHFL